MDVLECQLEWIAVQVDNRDHPPTTQERACTSVTKSKWCQQDERLNKGFVIQYKCTNPSLFPIYYEPPVPDCNLLDSIRSPNTY
jgi:hypothetical protein